MTVLRPVERRYMIFLHDIRKPRSCQRPSQRTLKSMVERGLIRVARQSRTVRGPNGADYALTPTGKFLLEMDGMVAR